MAQPSMGKYRGDEIQPGNHILSDEQIDDWVIDNVESAYHPSGSCKMGLASDPMAVVDNSCNVIGLTGIRVVDASIFPTIPNGNLNAPTIMSAEKAADIILGKPALTPLNAKTWIDPEWKNRQRVGQPINPYRQT